MSNPLNTFKEVLNTSKYLGRFAIINSYICDKFYHVVYKRELDEKKVNGVLLNYNGGTIDLLTEDGIYHIEYRDIVFMRPVKMPKDKINEEFNELLKALKIEF